MLPEQLREKGATVDVIPVYRTIAPEADLNRLKAHIESGAIDAVTFTSSSTVRNFVDMVGGVEQARRRRRSNRRLHRAYHGAHGGRVWIAGDDHAGGEYGAGIDASHCPVFQRRGTNRSVRVAVGMSGRN